MDNGIVLPLLALLGMILVIHNHLVDYLAHQVRAIASNQGIDTTKPEINFKQLGLFLVLSIIMMFGSSGETVGTVFTALLVLITGGAAFYYFKDIQELTSGKYNWQGTIDAHVTANPTPSSDIPSHLPTPPSPANQTR